MQNQCRQVLLLFLFYERVISILLENYFHLIIYRLYIDFHLTAYKFPPYYI